MIRTLRRGELYELVWSKPMESVSEEFGLSGRGLAKICQRMEIPVPGRGYWAKIQAGKTMPIPPLPELTSRGIDEYLVRIPDGKSDTKSDAIKLVEQREKSAEYKITVPAILEDELAAISKTAKSLRAAKPDEQGLLSPGRKRSLNIKCGPDSLDRALRIMDALLRAAEVRDWSSSVSGEEPFHTLIYVDGEEVAISLVEKARNVPHQPTEKELREKEKWSWTRIPEFDRIPSGLLALHIHGLEWSGLRAKYADGKTRGVEDLLNSFMVGLAKAAEYRKSERIRKAEREREWEEQARLRDEARKREREEADRVRHLNGLVARHDEAVRIRSFLDDFDASGLKGDELRGLEPEEWRAWARQYADRLDPLK